MNGTDLKTGAKTFSLMQSARELANVVIDAQKASDRSGGQAQEGVGGLTGAGTGRDQTFYAERAAHSDETIEPDSRGSYQSGPRKPEQGQAARRRAILTKR